MLHHAASAKEMQVKREFPLEIDSQRLINLARGPFSVLQVHGVQGSTAKLTKCMVHSLQAHDDLATT
jgi:hypothetical protein